MLALLVLDFLLAILGVLDLLLYSRTKRVLGRAKKFGELVLVRFIKERHANKSVIFLVRG